MVANISTNYMLQTGFSGTFNVTSSGGVQGAFVDDPAVIYQLAGGVLSQNETIPMWGGVGVNVTITPNTGSNPPDGTQGGIISRATNVTVGASGQLIGFSTFNQAYGMLSTPQSPVPLAASGMQVMYFRLGSNARIYVAAAPQIATTSFEGTSIQTQVSWDFVGQQLIPYIAAYTSASVSSATYTSSTGILALTFGSAPFGAGVGSTANGVYISISGLTTSAGSASNVNGLFPITSTGASGTVINVQAAAGLGTITINGSTGTLAAGGGALPVNVLEVTTNSMTVNYATATGFATWNYNGTVALIEI